MYIYSSLEDYIEASITLQYYNCYITLTTETGKNYNYRE